MEEESADQLSEAWRFVEPYWPESAWLQALAILAVAAVIALLASLVVRGGGMRLATRTKTDLDDKIVEAIWRPVSYSILLIGFWEAVHLLDPPRPFPFAIRGAVLSAIVVMWTFAGAKVVDEFLDHLVRIQERLSWVQPRTLPLFKMAGWGFVWGGGLYFFFLAWDLDLTAWLASAGIVGIAVGFAAQDTLANLFAGIAILADGPYKLGDYVVLGSGERGKVIEIGMRTTRLVTLDNVEIVVPNSAMANAKLTNQSGGPGLLTRVSTTVEAAYDSDVDKVRKVLLEVAEGLPHTLDYPPPNVHFSAFGASGLVFNLRVWVGRPEERELVLDRMNDTIFKRFGEAGIEIPFSKHDVYLYPQDGKVSDPDT